MKDRRYIITGRNKLTGEREAITRPMGENEALARLEIEKNRRKNKRHCAHAWLRVERVLPVELELNFIPE